MLLVLVLVGCEGKSLIDDNPVFTAAPPRRSLTNSSSVVRALEDDASDIQAVSFTDTKGAALTGTATQ